MSNPSAYFVRRPDGTIDLVATFELITSSNRSYRPNDKTSAIHHLQLIEGIMPITSRQAAAVALADAMRIARG